MDKSLLYKLPKDILVELVCKNFDRLSVKELGEIYRKKCCKELNRYREILDKTYHAGKISIEYVKGVIHIDDASSDFTRKYIFLIYRWKTIVVKLSVLKVRNYYLFNFKK